jgi:hypothetical protein
VVKICSPAFFLISSSKLVFSAVWFKISSDFALEFSLSSFACSKYPPLSVAVSTVALSSSVFSLSLCGASLAGG